MRRIFWLVLITFVLLAFARAAPKGTAPRSSPSDYPAHAQQDGAWRKIAHFPRSS